MLRQPIIVLLGHVDHGKTTLLDMIRRTVVASKEAGGITQSIGTTAVPIDTVKKYCVHLLDKFDFKLDIPGLLFIDTPGHEAFSTLRKRGGSIADLAVLVIDINEGMKPQTIESLEILKETKTPFIVALNKIDRITGWISEDKCFVDSFPKQNEDVKGEFEQKFYSITNEISKYGFNVDRFDRINDFKSTVAVVPVSGKSGEGIPDLLIMLTGISQQFLKDKLLKTEESKGIILEVKPVTGLGTAIDTVIYDGIIHRNDFLIIGGKNPTISKIKALLIPEVLKDIRTEKKFTNIDHIHAAAGVKISSPGLDDVIAGSPIRTAKTFREAEKLMDEMEKEREDVEIHAQNSGLILKADNVGSLEALITIFKKYSIKEASIGDITKTDVMKTEANRENNYRIIIGFNVKTASEAEKMAKDRNIKIIGSDVIYRLIENYEKWISEEKERVRKEEMESAVKPGKIRILPGCVFRASNPAILGCEVLGGTIKPEYEVMKDGKTMGRIKQIQSDGKNVSEAKKGEKVAVSISDITFGRGVNENDELYTNINSRDYKQLMKHEGSMSSDEKEVLEEITEIKRKTEKNWGY